MCGVEIHSEGGADAMSAPKIAPERLTDAIRTLRILPNRPSKRVSGSDIDHARGADAIRGLRTRSARAGRSFRHLVMLLPRPGSLRRRVRNAARSPRSRGPRVRGPQAALGGWGRRRGAVDCRTSSMSREPASKPNDRRTCLPPRRRGAPSGSAARAAPTASCASCDGDEGLASWSRSSSDGITRSSSTCLGSPSLPAILTEPLADALRSFELLRPERGAIPRYRERPWDTLTGRSTPSLSRRPPPHLSFSTQGVAEQK